MSATHVQNAVRPLEVPLYQRKTVRIGLPILILLITCLSWEGLSRSGVVNPITLPPISAIAFAFFELLGKRFFWEAVIVTLQETMLGFVIGASVGLVIGAMTGTFPMFRVALFPFIVAFQNTPRVALAPVFLTWFGFGMTSKVVMAAVICFFPVVINTVAGLAAVDQNGRLLYKTLGASTRQTFFKFTLPSAAPITFAGIKTALTLALLGAIVAEFVGGSEGLGVLVKEFNFQLRVDMAFAVILVLASIGLILYGLIEIAERKIIFWVKK
ncbi:MAG: ABC transporter permease [Devosia sp.]|nr:ABC transporter permease [Devosia sp.]